MKLISLSLFSFLLSFSLPANLLDDFKNLEVLNEVSFTEEKSELTVVFTLSPFCPCSESHLKHLIELSQKNPNLQFVGLNTDTLSEHSEAQAYYRGVEANFPIVHDIDLKMARRMEAVTTPHVFVFNDSSRRALYEGAVTNSAHYSPENSLLLAQAIKDLVSGQRPARRKTRPHGCSINYAL